MTFDRWTPPGAGEQGPGGSEDAPATPAARPPAGPPLPPPSGAPVAPPTAPSAWAHLAPEQLTHLHQPGIVPLRPLTMGDIFGGALQTMRRNPSATIGTALVVMAVLLVPSYLLSLAVGAAPGLAYEDASALVTLVTLLFMGLASTTLAGMIVHVVGEAVLGDRVTLQETWRDVRGRIPALVGTVLLISLLFVALSAVLVGVIVGALVVMDSEAVSSGGAVALVLLIVAAVVGFVVLMMWASARVSLATPTSSRRPARGRRCAARGR